MHKVFLCFLLSVSSAFAIPQKMDFTKQVWPLIERSCLECHMKPHKNKLGKFIKPKAGLIFEDANGIMKGSRDGKVILPGQPEKSLFYTLLILDHDDDDLMPSKGDPLSKTESNIIYEWIKQGAHFGDWEGAKNYRPGDLAEKIKIHLLPEEVLAKSLKAPTENQLKQAKTSKASIQALAVNSPLYDVEYTSINQDITDKNFSELESIYKYISRLDLHKTKITSKSFSKLSKCQNLVRLNLRETSIKDTDLQHLLPLKHLNYLNLYQTNLSNKSIQHLSQMKQLKYLYLSQTKITAQGIQKLKKALTKTNIIASALN